MSKFIVEEKKAQPPVPVGMYSAEYIGIEDFTSPKIEGDKWKWLWRVVAGEHAGKTVDTLTDQKIDKNALSGKLIAGLIGREIVAGDDLEAEINACRGRKYQVCIMNGPKGGKPAVRMVSAAAPAM